jgi:arylsulfatase A-like enzyme
MRNCAFSAKGFVFVAFAVFVSLSLASSGCRRGERTAGSVLHLADSLKLENIRQSPLLTKAPAGLGPADYPVESYPVIEPAKNPLGLLRKHDLGTSVNRILYAPTKSEYVFDVALPVDPVLSFGIGIVRDGNSEAAMTPRAKASDGAEFIVLLEIEGRRKTLYQKHLGLPPKRDSRTLNFVRTKVEIPRTGKNARLTFLTGGEPGLAAFWQNPAVISRRAEPTNVVVVSIDALRADHVGVYGYERDTTPHLDALAAESAVFRNVYAAAPWTLPSHISMLTGLDCRTHRVYYEGDRLDPARRTLASILRANGYTCGAVTGGGFVNAIFGFSKGFESYGMDEGEIGAANLAENSARLVAGWLDVNADRPFFLFLHTYQVHTPYHPPEAYAGRYLSPGDGRKSWDFVANLGGWTHTFRPLPELERLEAVGLYDAEIRYTDEALIGPLIEKLKALGVYDRTLLIVTSDHGTEFFDHGGWHHTWSLYNGTIKVPLIVKFPGKRFAGRSVSPAVRSIDIVPTVLETLGIGFEAETFDGRSLRPVLLDRERENRPILAELAPGVLGYRLPGRVAVSAGNDKLILNGAFSPEDLGFLAAPPPAIPPLELYDLTGDPREERNLAGEASRAAAVRTLSAAAGETTKVSGAREGRREQIPRRIQDQLRALGYIK